MKIAGRPKTHVGPAVSAPAARRAPLCALLLAATLSAGCGVRAAPAAAPWWTGFADADTVRVTQLVAGVRHVYLWLPRGPWAVHVVEMDERVCAPLVSARKAGPPLAATELTTLLGRGSLVAINADFFQDPGGTPVGAHVRAGRVLAGPGARPLYALTAAGAHWAGWGRHAGHAVAWRDSVAITQVNRPVTGGRHQPPVPGLTLFDEWYGDEAPAVARALRLRRVADGDAGIVVSIHGPASSAALDGGHVVLQAVGDAAGAWLAARAVGDTVRWQSAVVPAPGPAGEAAAGQGGRAGAAAAAVEAVGGFPMLLAAGRGVYGEQTGVIAGFGPVRHPRTAVGWDEISRRLFWVVVDGRQPPYSDGMSLPELEWLFLRLGATDAINLDGGGSTALSIADRLVNRPTDVAGERPVANVLALDGCR